MNTKLGFRYDSEQRLNQFCTLEYVQYEAVCTCLNVSVVWSQIFEGKVITDVFCHLLTCETWHLAETQHDSSASFTGHHLLITDMLFTQHDVISPDDSEGAWNHK